MLCALIATSLIAPARTLNILFLGNSHTSFNNLTGMVEGLIESDGSGRSVNVKTHSGAFLNDISQNPQVRQDIQSGQWHVLVLQGAKLSNSHKYQYDHSGGAELAKLAKKHKMDALLFAEWPRRGWNETGYILDQYKMISKPSGASIVPICVAWDAVLKQRPNDVFWASDGNHAAPAGSFVAAATIAAWLAEPKSKTSTYTPQGIDSKLSAVIKTVAKQTVDKYK
ncbi:MAG: hypothetical protein H7Y17_00160 [Chlorobia bacterium]|nr:hypothetical protein [Fimbriimonadaceae bacterium]